MNTGLPQVFDARALPPLAAFLPTSTWREAGRTAAAVKRRGWTPPAVLHTGSIDDYRAHCRALNVVRAGLPARTPNASWGGTGNDPVRAAVTTDPEFFVGYGALDCASPDPGQAAELVSDGFVGATFEPFLSTPLRPIDDEIFTELLGSCADLHLPVLLMSGGELDQDAGSPSRIERLARRHPRLRIVVVHGGWPRAQEALQLAFQNPNVWLMPDLYFPGLPGEADYLLALRTFLADRTLYASSYPYTPLDEHLARIERLGLDDATLDRFLFGNAAELFST